MKVRSIFAALLLMMAGLQTAWAQKMVVTLTDNSKVRFNILQVKDVMFEECEYVDLGLPSGTLWATTNIGAASPEDIGDYFAWGETSPKSGYDFGTYANALFTKYTISDATELLPEDDAAAVNWGNDWRMPSKEQCEELINSSYTTTEWTQLNGVDGRLIKSRSNGKSIFLPATGYYSNERMNDTDIGFFWSREMMNSNNDMSYYCFCLKISSSSVQVGGWLRTCGLPVRPVRKQ